MAKEQIKVFHPYHKEVSKETFYIQGDLLSDVSGWPEKIILRASNSASLVELLYKEFPSIPIGAFTSGINAEDGHEYLVLDIFCTGTHRELTFTQVTRNYVKCELISYQDDWKMSIRDKEKLH